jgi:hypothetical protein
MEAPKKAISHVTRMHSTKNDRYYTPPEVVKIACDMCNITPEMKVLDPCMGDGAFYNNLPPCEKDWAEIDMGRDFFEETRQFDLIISNPPYSLWDKWLEHTGRLTNKFCYVMALMSATPKRMTQIFNMGFGITKMHLFSVPSWFGPTLIVLFERNQPSIMSVSPNSFVVICKTCGDSWNHYARSKYTCPIKCADKPTKKK